MVWRCACGFGVILLLSFINFFHFFDLVFPGPIGIRVDNLVTQLTQAFSTDHLETMFFVCLCWGFTAQSTQWDHVERGQFT